MTRKPRFKVIDIHGSMYANIPFWLCDEYGVTKGASIEFDRSDPISLRMIIRGGKNIE